MTDHAHGNPDLVEIRARRFGPHFPKRCRRLHTIICAVWTCQYRDECADPPKGDRDMNSFGPRAYNLDDPAEIKRLLRECEGYLNTCRRDHHGTDLLGRQLAMVALHRLAERGMVVAPQEEPVGGEGISSAGKPSQRRFAMHRASGPGSIWRARSLSHFPQVTVKP